MTPPNWSPPPTTITQLPPVREWAIPFPRVPLITIAPPSSIVGATWKPTCRMERCQWTACYVGKRPTHLLFKLSTDRSSNSCLFIVVSFLRSRSMPMGQMDSNGLIENVWTWGNDPHSQFDIICDHLSIHIACPSGTAKKCGDLQVTLVFLFTMPEVTTTELLVYHQFPQHITLHYTTLHYTTLLYIYTYHYHHINTISLA